MYIYTDVLSLEGKPKVSTGQCAALIQYYTKAPLVSRWREGAIVRGNKNIKVGTAIATFVNGRYPNLDHGNHAAFYLGQNALWIQVMDQWTNKKSISSRTLAFKGKLPNGKYADVSNNGDAFSIIE
jgi:hypothetical protein